MTKNLSPLIMAELLKADGLKPEEARKIAEQIASAIGQRFQVISKPPLHGRPLAAHQEAIKRDVDEHMAMRAEIDRKMGFARNRA